MGFASVDIVHVVGYSYRMNIVRRYYALTSALVFTPRAMPEIASKGIAMKMSGKSD